MRVKNNVEEFIAGVQDKYKTWWACFKYYSGAFENYRNRGFPSGDKLDYIKSK